MDRRTFVRGAVVAATCPVCAGLAAKSAWASGKADWSYGGENGPANWGKLDPSYSACGTGTRQSPVDLSNAVDADIGKKAISWNPVRLAEVVNNGHTIQVNTPGAGIMNMDGVSYDLLQFHFHHKSEHTVDGEQFPLEVHFVHKETDGSGLAVIGVFFREGDENASLKPIWAAAPEKEGTASSADKVDPMAMLPDSRAGFRYSGSLTTPPCSEIVAWNVLKNPITASKAQIEAFAKLFPNNFRPVQPLNRRFILFGG